MSRTENKALLQEAAGAEWNQDGVETISFDDPHDINGGGTAFLYGDSGVVRLELSLPADRAAEVIEFVRKGRPLSNPCLKIPIEELLTTMPRAGTTYASRSGPGQSSELDDLIADQARDLAEDRASSLAAVVADE